VSVAPGGFGADVLTGNIDYSSAFDQGGGGGIDLGNILKGGIQAGLNSLLGGLFGGSSSGGSSSSSGSGAFSDLLAAGPAAYFDNELIERATERVQSETLKNLNNLRATLNDLANLTRLSLSTVWKVVFRTIWSPQLSADTIS
jgi:hypothetical protein